MCDSKRSFTVLLVAVLLLVGVSVMAPALAQGPIGDGGMGGPGHMGPDDPMDDAGSCPGQSSGFAPGWMMGNQGDTGIPMPTPGSMMGGMMSGMMGQAMNGMMGGSMMLNSNSPFFVAPAPLTLTEVADALAAYLSHLNDSNLEIGEVMIFDNHAYAQITEVDSGIGVLEVLIDPETKAVFPEMGPNMMWNLKYGMMSGFGGFGMMGGMMMGGFGVIDASTEMTVTPEQAVERAQAVLDTCFSEANLTADKHADPFYGYYTLHVNRDGKTVGMLSVNGFSGEVFPHTWHGTLLEMTGE
ncbi:MAG: hypothetical protein ACYSUD_00125 [Planctomycetota bacterium]